MPKRWKKAKAQNATWPRRSNSTVPSPPRTASLGRQAPGARGAGSARVRRFEPATPPKREVGERIEFDSTARGKKERVWGYLSFPAKAQPKYPLMLILHASGGVHDRDWSFARTLNDIGAGQYLRA